MCQAGPRRRCRRGGCCDRQLRVRTWSTSFRFQRGVEARIEAPRVGFVDLVPLLWTDVRSFDVAPGVIEIMPGFRVDAAYSADHFAREQDVVRGNHAGEQVDSRLVVHAGVEED